MFMQLVFFLIVTGFLGSRLHRLYLENKYLSKHLRERR